MEIKIPDLTREQAQMLDHMWTLDTKDKFFSFFETLDEDKMHMVLTLQELVIQEVMERDYDEGDMSKKMLAKIGVKV